MRGEGAGQHGAKKLEKTSLRQRSPGRSAGEEPRRERSEKLWDWSELQGKAGETLINKPWLEFKRQLSSFQLQDGISCKSRVSQGH